jgi:LPXTG-site transpeptidase (sortase) family protein
MKVYWRPFLVTLVISGCLVVPRSLAVPDHFATSRYDVVQGIPTVPASLPARLTIPAISVDTPFEVPLGITAGGEIVVPSSYDQVGWYAYGPTPGEVGPAVVLGHVSSYRGPAVFSRLSELTVGEQIFVTRSDGSTVQFEVVAVETVPIDTFPTAAVYGDTATPTLRLLTCAGAYDRHNSRYSHTTIVYAELVSPPVQLPRDAI